MQGRHDNRTPWRHDNRMPRRHDGMTTGRHDNRLPGRHDNRTPGPHDNRTPGPHDNRTLCPPQFSSQLPNPDSGREICSQPVCCVADWTVGHCGYVQHMHASLLGHQQTARPIRTPDSRLVCTPQLLFLWLTY